MNSLKYKRYRAKWNNYWKEQEWYRNERQKLVDSNATFEEIEAFRQKSRNIINNPGVWTVIDDPNDLRDPNFILPGMETSFMGYENTDHKIPDYFGLHIYERDSMQYRGVVCGYAYDAYDDYILTTIPGKCILVNSYYHVSKYRMTLTVNVTDRIELLMSVPEQFKDEFGPWIGMTLKINDADNITKNEDVVAKLEECQNNVVVSRSISTMYGFMPAAYDDSLIDRLFELARNKIGKEN